MIVPFPPTPAICVPSRLHATLSREPELGFSCVSNHCMQCKSPLFVTTPIADNLESSSWKNLNSVWTKPDLVQILHYHFSVGHTTIHQQPTTRNIKLIILVCIISLVTPSFINVYYCGLHNL